MSEIFAGRYEFIAPIGRGGMGTVWTVWDRRDHVLRAAKVLRYADADSLLRFVREQATRIDHAHCLTPLNWAGEDGRVLFTMDLVRGGSVATLLGDFGALPPEWAALLLDQLLTALDAVHAAGLVHRDVKPANLLLEPTGRGRPHLRLGDFGVAVALSAPRMTRAANVLGTSGYQAPEYLAGADPDPVQDLWAVGVLLSEMLTGQEPPAGLVAPPTECPVGVDPQLWALAGQLAAPAPQDRPASAAIARELLRATGHVPGPGDVPDDDGWEIEVLDQVAGATTEGSTADVSGAGPTTSRVRSGLDATLPPPPRPIDPPRADVPRPSDRVAVRQARSGQAETRWWRTRSALLGVASMVSGVVLVVAAGVLVS